MQLESVTELESRGLSPVVHWREIRGLTSVASAQKSGQFMVGASRRRAAPRSQSSGAAQFA